MEAGNIAELPWPYEPLNVELVFARPYENHDQGGCVYTAFEAIAAPIAKKLAEEYARFPF